MTVEEVAEFINMAGLTGKQLAAGMLEDEKGITQTLMMTPLPLPEEAMWEPMSMSLSSGAPSLSLPSGVPPIRLTVSRAVQNSSNVTNMEGNVAGAYATPASFTLVVNNAIEETENTVMTTTPIHSPIPARPSGLVTEESSSNKHMVEDEDESVLNLAATLCSFSSSSATPSAPPSATSSPSVSPNVSVQGEVTEGKPDLDEPTPDGKVKAYAKLQGPDWAFYLKKPSLTMGRAPSQAKQFSVGDSCPVDFYLSSADSLSRTHLRIDYNPDRVRWEMSCLGKSGVRVDKRRYEAFCPPIPLFCDSQITVANATFNFVLPLDAASREGSPFDRCIRKRKSEDAVENVNNAEEEKNDESGSGESEIEDTSGLVGVGEYSKPPQSYANLIAEAINSTPSKRMTLSCIYQYLADKYPYFRHTKNGWQNSVRHNLSLNKAFKKVPRGIDEPGKGMLWIIDPEYKHLVDGSIGRRTSVRSRTPDVPSVATRPPLTFIHHHQGMYQANPSQQLFFHYTTQPMYNQQQYVQPPPRPTPILPAPDPSHLRPIANIAAAISPTVLQHASPNVASVGSAQSSHPPAMQP